jgi:hypothetical protein
VQVRYQVLCRFLEDLQPLNASFKQRAYTDDASSDRIYG